MPEYLMNIDGTKADITNIALQNHVKEVIYTQSVKNRLIVIKKRAGYSREV